MKGHAPRQAAVPAAAVELLSGEQVVFRHRLPVRAVRRAVATRLSSPPKIDRPWAALADKSGASFFAVGDKARHTHQAAMKAAYDDENLYVACRFWGLDVAKVPRQIQKRDARRIHQTDNIEVLIDTDAAEKAYLQFVATPAGGQADVRNYYYPFAGHFTRKREWNADWSVQTAWRDDGYLTLVTIPFKSLGATPKPGTVWRMNVAANVHAGRAKAEASTWSPCERSAHEPRSLGAILFQ